MHNKFGRAALSLLLSAAWVTLLLLLMLAFERVPLLSSMLSVLLAPGFFVMAPLTSSWGLIHSGLIALVLPLDVLIYWPIVYVLLRRTNPSELSWLRAKNHPEG